MTHLIQGAGTIARSEDLQLGTPEAQQFMAAEIANARAEAILCDSGERRDALELCIAQKS